MTTRSGRTPTRRLLAVALGVLGAAALVPLGLEAYYRFGYNRPDAFMITRASQRWFDRYYHRNARGFRADSAYANERAPGKRRIAFLGDSYTSGHGIRRIEDRFTDRIQVGLGDGWEVHNLGALDADTQDESTLIQQMVKRKYAVDEIVLVYNLDDILTGVPVVMEASNRLHAYFGNPGFWVKHSDWLELRALRHFAATDSIISHGDDMVGAAYSSPDLVEVEQARIGKLHEILGSKGIALRIVTMPMMRDLGRRDRFKPIHAMLDRMWTELGIPSLDLLPVLEPHVSEGLMVSQDDPHPNERAHALIADAVLDFLKRTPVPNAAQPAPPK